MWIFYCAGGLRPWPLPCSEVNCLWDLNFNVHNSDFIGIQPCVLLHVYSVCGCFHAIVEGWVVARDIQSLNCLWHDLAIHRKCSLTPELGYVKIINRARLELKKKTSVWVTCMFLCVFCTLTSCGLVVLLLFSSSRTLLDGSKLVCSESVLPNRVETYTFFKK